MNVLKKIVDIKQKMLNGIASLDMQIVDHCNLNCCGCDHFAPLAKKWEIDIDVYKNLLQRLMHIKKDKNIYEFNIMGGEPFLHSRFIDICKITKDILDCSKIVVVTNGILYEKNRKYYDEIFNVLNIKLSISDYLDTNKMFYSLNLSKNDLSENNRVCCFNRTMDFDIIKNHEYKHLFSLVPCAQLNYNGDLFSCIVPANIHIFNDYFREEYYVEKGKDYINIYEVDDLNEIIAMNNAKEIPFCKFCKNQTIKKWEVSNKLKNEWIYK